MKLTFGRYFLKLTKLQFVALFIVPLLLVMLVSYFQNRKPVYEVSMVLNLNITEPARPERGALKGYSREIRRLYTMKWSQEKAQARLRLSTKLALLKSNRLKYAFIKHYHIKPILFPNRWNSQTQQWTIQEPGMLANALSLLRTPEPKERKPKEPSDFTAAQKLNIMVKKDQDTGFFNLTLKHSNPYQAAQILNNYVAFADDFIANDRIQELMEKESFLLSIFTKESNHSIKQEIADELFYIKVLLHTQTGPADKSFKVLEPAIAPQKPSYKFSPILSVIVFLFGFMLTLMFVLNQQVKLRKHPISNKVHSGQL